MFSTDREAKFEQPPRHPEKYVAGYGISPLPDCLGQPFALRLLEQLALPVPDDGLDAVGVHNAEQARCRPGTGPAENYPNWYAFFSTRISP